MNNSPFFCWFMPMLLAILGHGAVVINRDDDCQRSCRHGPDIRFPFRLKGQPEHCGYVDSQTNHGFELSCSDDGYTQLHLQTSGKLYVREINYVQQLINVSDPNKCLPKQARNFTLSGSPFTYPEWESYDGYGESIYAIYSCPTSDVSSEQIDCLSANGNYVYAFNSNSYSSISYIPLVNCTKLYNVSSIPAFFQSDNTLTLTWLKPKCGKLCEIKGFRCGLKNNGSGPGLACLGAPPPDKDRSKRIVEAVSIGVGSVLFVLALAAFLYFFHAIQKEKKNAAKIEKFLEDYKALKPTRYSYADLKRITNDFKDKLGQGAYGSVFKGRLSNEIYVAVKILNDSAGNGEEFINEVGTMGRIHHVNVVRLVGFCADGFRRALVYEFLPNESLEKFIFSSDTRENHNPLGWEKLQDIAIGIAKGIEYLHQGCDQRILHFDIKPHNILLDDNFTPKIADFGLAKLCAKDQSAVSMTAARGTMGYIAPEVFSRNFGSVSYKSDVYSFGMMLLEMVGGRKNIDVNVENAGQVYFPEWIYKHLEQGEELMIRIEEEGDAKIAKKLTIVGLWCIQWYPVDRPSIKIVVQMLELGEGYQNLTMPPNPFSSAVPQKMDGYAPGRHLFRELEVISESEVE